MRRLDPTLNSGTTQYLDGNPMTGAGGTVLQAGALQAIQEELANIVLDAGGTLDPSNNGQVLAKIKAIAAAAAANITPPNAFKAASEAAMLAQGAKDNDICVRTDLSNQWLVCTALPSSNIANWAALPVQQAIVPATLAEVQAGTAGKLVPAEHAKATYLSKTDTADQSVTGSLYAPNLLVYRGEALGDLNNITVQGTYLYAAGNHSGNPTNAPSGMSSYGLLIVLNNSNFLVQQLYSVVSPQAAFFRTSTTNVPSTSWATWQPLGGASLGVNQTRQNVTANRAINVPYSNNTGAPIFISISLNTSTTVQIDDGTTGNNWSQFWMGGGVSIGGITAVIPNGATYRLTGASAIGQWIELRA